MTPQTAQPRSPAVAYGAQLAYAATVAPLNDRNAWMVSPAHKSPLSDAEIAAVQKEIDAIIGTTRENASIALLVWNGDTRYWKQFHDQWNALGKPVGEPIKRPIVLDRTIYNATGEKLIRDVFPPRWLLLTRMEPEQYYDTWNYETKFFHPELKIEVQILPSEPPKVRYRYFRIIAEHRNDCCLAADREDRDCHGFYAHPRYILDDLRRIRKSMEADNFRATPFAPPSALARKQDAADSRNDNYVEQTLARFKAVRERLMDETPMAVATKREFMKTPDLVELRRAIAERNKWDEENLEKTLRRRSKNS